MWFKGGPEVDADIISRFKGDCEALLRGDYDSWQHQTLEALAGIVLGDQLARNTYRGGELCLLACLLVGVRLQVWVGI